MNSSTSNLKYGKELFEVAGSGDIEAVRQLLNNSDIDLEWTNDDGSTSLINAFVHYYTASNTHHLEIIKMLIAAGADVTRNEYGSTALHYSMNGEITQILLKRGANPNSVAINGTTPLMNAALAGVTEVIEVLITAGANVNQVDNEGCTALMYNAGMCGGNKVLDLLIKSGADINAQDHNGWTALMHATESCCDREEKMKMLIKAGADVNAKNNDEKTALDLKKYYITEESVNPKTKPGIKELAALKVKSYLKRVPNLIKFNTTSERPWYFNDVYMFVKTVFSAQKR